MVYITTHKVKSSGSVGSHDTNMFLIAEVRGDSETQIVVQVKDWKNVRTKHIKGNRFISMLMMLLLSLAINVAQDSRNRFM